jgi:hypothetical protein
MNIFRQPAFLEANAAQPMYRLVSGTDLKNRIGGNIDNCPWRMQGYSLDQR